MFWLEESTLTLTMPVPQAGGVPELHTEMPTAKMATHFWPPHGTPSAPVALIDAFQYSAPLVGSMRKMLVAVP